MTAPSPAPRSRKLYVPWAIALTLLLATGAFCWAVVVPVWQVRKVVTRNTQMWPASGPWCSGDIRNLGGPEEAASHLGGYLRMPQWLAPHKDIAVRMLGQCGPPAQPHLIHALGNSDDQVVVTAAADTLGDMGDEAACPYLIALIEKREDWTPWQAIAALGKVGDKRALDVLVAALKNGHITSREEAARALGRLRLVDAVDPLIEALADKHAPVRAASARALGMIRSKRAADALKTAAQDKDDLVRTEAGWAIAQLGQD